MRYKRSRTCRRNGDEYDQTAANEDSVLPSSECCGEDTLKGRFIFEPRMLRRSPTFTVTGGQRLIGLQRAHQCTDTQIPNGYGHINVQPAQQRHGEFNHCSPVPISFLTSGSDVTFRCVRISLNPISLKSFGAAFPRSIHNANWQRLHGGLGLTGARQVGALREQIISLKFWW